MGSLVHFPASVLTVLYFFKKKKFCPEKVSFIFLKKAFLIFLYFRKGNTVKTLSKIYDETFCKNSYVAHFPVLASKPFSKNLTIKIFLIFWEMELSYDSGNGALYVSYILESNLQGSKD